MAGHPTRRTKAEVDGDGPVDQGATRSPGVGKLQKKSRPKRKKLNGARRRGIKPYPVITFQQALRIGQGIAVVGSGMPVKRETLLEKLGLPNTRSTRAIITASGKYGITIGSHDAPVLKLTEQGAKAVSETATIDRSRARIKLAITDIDPFKRLYERFQGRKMPAVEVMRDSLDDMDEGDRNPCVDIFVQNAKFVGVLQTREGAEFITTIEEAAARSGAPSTDTVEIACDPVDRTVAGEDFDSVCFFIAPIGDGESEHRRHSDAILSSYVEKALSTVEPRLRVVRADKITQPGMITKQVLEYLLKSKLVVADLSYHNPNVFYELAVRHVTGKPVIHIKRSCDPIPFDNKDFRTIDIKFEDKYEILAEIETVRSTIAQFSRQALGSGDNSDNPLLIYFPEHRFSKTVK